MTAKVPLKVHLRLRFQNLGKPRTAGLCGREVPLIGALSATKPRSAGLSEVLKPQSKVHLERCFRSHRWTSGTENARNSGLFKVDVPQAVEEFAVFDHSKK